MFTHVMVGANDIERSKGFYDATLGALDVPPGKSDDKGRIFYRTPAGTFAIARPINGEPAAGANGGTIGFAAGSPGQVDAWHAAGLASGGAACEEPPGPRGDGRLYLAYLRDPAGNKLCALHRMTA